VNNAPASARRPSFASNGSHPVQNLFFLNWPGGTTNAKFLIDNHLETPQYLKSVMLLMEVVGSFR